jgi:ArsR family metal-binding transcriptional regulator
VLGGGGAYPCYEHPGYIDVLVIAYSSDNKVPRLEQSPIAGSPRYPIECCDKERWIPISTIGKRGADEYDYEPPSKKNKFTPQHDATWDKFRQYLEQCIPVKIKDVALFRDSSPRMDDRENHDDIRIFPSDVALLPSSILDSTVTAQCAFLSKSGEETDSSHLSPQEIDNAISLSSANNTIENSFPIFMGQEDQITTEMTLIELIHWSSSASMAVCAAQVPIATSSDEKSIHINLDGSLIQLINIHEDDPQISQLSSMLRLPSYLLLRDPSEDIQGCNGKIFIHNINLWHTPQTCCTNVHYDDHDNILMVTQGEKIVELCPPGCIRASSIFSEHANHPALLRNYGEIFSDESIRREIKTTLDQKQGRTHIVSISAGEALYIPRGWWHQVVSTTSSDEGTIGGCTAVNVWFDYTCASTVTPKHMIPFSVRNSAQKHYEKHAKNAASAALNQKQCCHKQLSDTSTEINMNVYGSILSNRWLILVKDIDDIEDKASMVNLFRMEIENYLFKHNLSDDFHVKDLINMWDIFPPSTRCGAIHKKTCQLFTKLIIGLSPESCFIITQAWEMHQEKSEVESSYKIFFELAGYENEKKVRTYLMSGVEEFRRTSYESFLSLENSE